MQKKKISADEKYFNCISSERVLIETINPTNWRSNPQNNGALVISRTQMHRVKYNPNPELNLWYS